MRILLSTSLYCILILLFSSYSLEAQTKPKPKSVGTAPKTQPKITPITSNFLDTILVKNPEYFIQITKNPKIHHVQIIYTQINRDKNNKASFVTYTYHLNKNEFFYAASMVKLPTCALAMEKVEELKKFGVSANTIMLNDSSNKCQHTTNVDESAKNGYPSVAHYVKRMLLVSDNQAYSRTFEFLTPEYINKKLWSKGYPTSRIRIRFDANCLGIPNNYSNQIRFLNDSGVLLYKQPPKYYQANALSMPVKSTIKLISFGPKELVRKDFSHSNFIALQDLHEILKSIMFPVETPPEKAFKISAENRRTLWQYLQMMPYESDYPNYPDRSKYIDSYKKYFYYGQDSNIIINKNIRSFNVVGESYGYTTECAYIVDFENKIEFLVSATYFIQKPNGTIDATSEMYNSFIMPFFRNLGQSIYNFELSRNKKYLPNLLDYKF